MISKLLLLGKYEIAVEMCIQEDRFTEAVLIANCFDKDLLAKTQKRFFKNHKNKFTNVIFLFILCTNQFGFNISKKANLFTIKKILLFRKILQSQFKY